MKTTKMLTILVFGLMVWAASTVHGSIGLTVNGEPVDSITLEVGQSCTIEVVMYGVPAGYEGYVGFDDGLVLGSFSHVQTTGYAGRLGRCIEYDEPDFYGYYIRAGDFYLTRAGVNHILQYEAHQLGETDLKLYNKARTSVIDSVHITVIPAPMGTAFTYQGSLNDANSPADGEYDFQFKLYNSPVDGNQLASTIDIKELDVIDGQFAVELDFGSDVFNGDAVWLEIGVRPGELEDPSEYTILQPRQEITPVPYALQTRGIFVDDAGNVGIGTTSPEAKLDVASRGGHAVRGWSIASVMDTYGVYGQHSATDTGINHPGDGQRIIGSTNGYIGGATIGAYGRFTRVALPGAIPFTNYAYLGGPQHGLYAKAGFGYAGYFDGNVHIKGNTTIKGSTTVRGKLYIEDYSTGKTVIKLGAGLDYAEGFDVSDEGKISPGTVLVIDADNPGKLGTSDKPYDSKVAGIVAGAKGQGSGVRLGSEQFDYDVALAGRVYCNVDATEAGVEPGDLLTTSPMPGYAMKAADYIRAQGAILGKAMERLEKGQKGQILVLVTLQ